ncbi:MAG: LacI family transcriptional regulator, partial [Actinomycetales bacterium]|nr:LacI family transcriptional regulator [Actinomycetales bacterium]
MADAARRTVLVVTTGYDEYQRWLVRGVRSVLPPDRHTIVVNSFNPTKRGLARPVVELIRELRPCGVLATSCVSPREETGLVDLLSELGVPTVRIGAQTPGMSCVRGDDATGMREVLRFLLDERGVRRPVLARGVPHQPDSLCRERVFREELAVRGIAVDEDLIIEGFFWHEATYLELRALLGRRRDLDAVVALNDLSALGAVKALGDEGLRVPEDVLVTGFDNDPAALPCWPQLTTVDPALEEQGAAAAAQLLAEVEHDAPRTEIVVPARLIVRGSTGLPPDCLAAAVSAATVGQQQLAARDALSALSFALSNCATPEDVVSTLGTSHLLRLGIRRFFLAVHVDGIRAPAGQEGTELRSRLLLDFREGRQWPVPEQVFPLTRLLPDDLAAELDGMLVFQPLTSGDHLIGYMLLEPCESSSGLVADALRTDLSRTLDAMFSTQALTDHAQELERTVAE